MAAFFEELKRELYIRRFVAFGAKIVDDEGVEGKNSSLLTKCEIGDSLVSNKHPKSGFGVVGEECVLLL